MTRAPAAETTAVTLRSWYAEAEAAAAIATQLSPTPFVPDSLKRWTLDDQGRRVAVDMDATVPVVTAALLAGQELGFGPMASLRSIDVIHGTPALRAIALRALVQHHGHDIWVVESTATRAIVRGQRSGGEVQQSVWTIDRAKQLGLYPGKEFGPWRKQPQNQLIARATAEVARWIAADTILGMPYIAEELADTETNGTVPEPEAEAAAAAPKTTRRRKNPARALPPPPVPAADTTPAPEPPEPPRTEPPPPDEKPKLITPRQLTALNTGLRELGVTSRQDAHALVASWIDRAVGSAKELTRAEAHIVLGKLNEAIEVMRGEAAADEEPPGEGDEAPPGEPPDEE